MTMIFHSIFCRLLSRQYEKACLLSLLEMGPTQNFAGQSILTLQRYPTVSDRYTIKIRDSALGLSGFVTFF